MKIKMEIKIQKDKAKEMLEKHIKECSEFLDANNMNLDFAKEQANDWYQELIEDLDMIYYDSSKIISEMNVILNKESAGPLIPDSLLRTVVYKDFSDRNLSSFHNKVRNIINLLQSLMSEL